MLLRVIGFTVLAGTLAAQTPDTQTTDTPATDGQSSGESAPAEYNGPSVLSRGLFPSVSGSPKNLGFRPYAGASGFCDTGLTSLKLNSKGQFTNTTTCGVDATLGIYGQHEGKETSVGLAYSADFRHYPAYQYYDGIDQSLSLRVGHRLGRRAMLYLQAVGALVQRDFTNPGEAATLTSLSLYGPSLDAQIFDNRVAEGQGMAELVLRLSPRWSVNMGADTFVYRYRSSALTGATGVGAQGDIAYRYSRFGTIGIAYSFFHFSFTHAFGATDFHTIGGLYSLRLSRRWEFSANLGAARVESLGLELVAVNPVVALITGQNFGVVAAYHLNYVPSGGASLTRSMRNGNVRFEYSRAVTPGNGVYLTSGQESATATVTYTGYRHWNFGADGGYTKLLPLVQTVDAYSGYTAGVGVTRDLAKSLYTVVRLDGRRYNVADNVLNRNTYRISVGLTWSPGDRPLALW